MSGLASASRPPAHSASGTAWPPADPAQGLKQFKGLASVSDFREVARRRLPRAIFDFIDGGAGHGVTLCSNEQAFLRYAFRPRVLTDVSKVNISTTILGRPVDIPIMLGPSGTQRLVTPLGEIAAARAAARFRGTYVLTVGASRT